MKHPPSISCPLYPCFDTLTGAAFKRTTTGRITFACRACPLLSRNLHLDTPCDAAIETLYFHKMRIINPKSAHCNDSSKIISTIENTKGICKNSILILSGNQKQALEIERSDKHQNIGVYSALSRDLTIACAHDRHLRPPPMPIVLLVKDRKIVGEMASRGKQFYSDKSACDCVLPPTDFPELTPFAKDIVSSSPGIMLDAWLRKKISIKPTDATLIIGLNRKQQSKPQQP